RGSSATVIGIRSAVVPRSLITGLPLADDSVERARRKATAPPARSRTSGYTIHRALSPAFTGRVIATRRRRLDRPLAHTLRAGGCVGRDNGARAGAPCRARAGRARGRVVAVRRHARSGGGDRRLLG